MEFTVEMIANYGIAGLFGFFIYDLAKRITLDRIQKLQEEITEIKKKLDTLIKAA